MHADERDTDVLLVRRPFVAQFPQWADLPLEPVRSSCNPVLPGIARPTNDNLLAHRHRAA